MKNWEKMAHYCSDTYGSYIDWEERFFICPECEEPIYECDYGDDGQLAMGCCPICEFDFMEEEE